MNMKVHNQLFSLLLISRPRDQMRSFIKRVRLSATPQIARLTTHFFEALFDSADRFNCERAIKNTLRIYFTYFTAPKNALNRLNDDTNQNAQLIR